MRQYLDPVYLTVTDDFWASREYVEIFESLVDSIEYIENIEKSIDSLYELVKFKFSDELFSTVYDNNPYKNQPTVQAFYANTFNTFIATLSRRFDWCSVSCLPSISSDDACFSPTLSLDNPAVPTDVLLAWLSLLKQCISCSARGNMLVLSPSSHATDLREIETATQRYLNKVQDISYFFYIPYFLSSHTLSEASLRSSVSIYFRQAKLADFTASRSNPQSYFFDENFWKSIEKSNLVYEDDEYKMKFISCLTQVVYSLDIDIRLHKYGSVKIGSKKYDKYSADVFKMGRGTNDSRCSRIFYCKVKNEICFYEFDPDFHKGE